MEYKIKETEDGVSVEGVRDLNLDHIFRCGQSFRWEQCTDGSYTGTAFGRVLNISAVRQTEEERAGAESNVLYIKNTNLEEFQRIWFPYFDLGRDYGAIKRELSRNDPVMKKAADYGGGIRILNQDEWETLVSFILSQNRNIPMIKKSVEALSVNFGEYIGHFDFGVSCDSEGLADDGAGTGGKPFYSFPSPEVLAELSPKDLDVCRLGYRAKYVIGTAKAVAEDKELLYRMSGEDYDTALEYLMGLCGVGPKVANCILLFSMEKYDSFPIDVWMRRLMAALYGLDEGNVSAMTDYAKEHFGAFGGFAQQYLFFYGRENNVGK